MGYTFNNIVDNQHNLFASEELDCICPPCASKESSEDNDTANNNSSGSGSGSSGSPNSQGTSPPINTLLSGRQWYPNTDRVVTYSFFEDDDFANSYYGSESGVQEVSEGIKSNFRKIVAWLENVIDIDFVEVDETDPSTFGQIRVQNSNNPGYAYAYYPGFTSRSGDIHFKTGYDRLGDTNGFQHDAGKHGYMTIVHELGHALGLAHTFSGTVLDPGLDNTDNSVMTYNFTGHSAGTFMALDVAALQSLYGAKTHNNGNTTYTFGNYIDQVSVNGVSLVDTSHRTKQLLWDSGGVDTLDFRGLNHQNSGFHLDLRGGGMLSTTFSGTTSYSSSIAYGFEVENLINSSSSDKIYLNNAANEIMGYNPNRSTGQDKIYYGTSQDTLILDYAHYEVTESQSGQNLIINLGGNGSVELVDYYADPNNQIQISYAIPPTPRPEPPEGIDIVIAEIGQISNLDHNNQTIVLDHDFVNPVILAQPLSFNDGGVAIARITDIQSDRFSVEIQEASNEDGIHTVETFSYLVLEEGIWELSDGTIIEVGIINATNSSWSNINFSYDFVDDPVVLTQIQTNNDSNFVKTRHNNITQDGFEVLLEKDEANNGTSYGIETVAWMAISSGTGSWDGNTFMAGNTGDQVTHDWHTIDFGNAFNNTPKFLGNIASYYGPDPSGLRYQNLNNGNVQIKIEEDTSADSEIGHTTEDVDYLAIEATGTLIGSTYGLIPPTSNDPIIAQLGQVTNLDHNNQTIVLDHDFDNPVIFANPLSYNGPAPSIARITDIQGDRFSVELQEPSNEDGTHAEETVSFLALEEGIWELSDGTIIEVGTIDTTHSDWHNINFSYDFVDGPVVLTQIQTNNDSSFVKTRHNNITQDGFEVLLENDEANMNSGHGNETVAWMAISSGTGSWDGNTFMAGNTGDQVTHDWHTIDFGNAFNNTPKFLGNIASYYGPDPSGLRYQNLNNSNVQVKIEEDISIDEEVTHITEDVHYLAIEATGTLTGTSYSPSSDPIIAQLGQVTNLDHNNQTIVLDHDFDNPVIFAQPLSFNGSAPSITRITDIQGDRFSVELQEPSNEDGTHAEETVSFFCMRKGFGNCLMAQLSKSVPLIPLTQIGTTLISVTIL